MTQLFSKMNVLRIVQRHPSFQFGKPPPSWPRRSPRAREGEVWQGQNPLQPQGLNSALELSLQFGSTSTGVASAQPEGPFSRVCYFQALRDQSGMRTFLHFPSGGLSHLENTVRAAGPDLTALESESPAPPHVVCDQGGDLTLADPACHRHCRRLHYHAEAPCARNKGAGIW